MRTTAIKRSTAARRKSHSRRFSLLPLISCFLRLLLCLIFLLFFCLCLWLFCPWFLMLVPSIPIKISEGKTPFPFHFFFLVGSPLFFLLFISFLFLFLVACYATLHPALSVRHTLLFGVLAVFGLTALAQMIVTPNTAPAHPHATGIAVYPALFQLELNKPKVKQTDALTEPLMLVQLKT